MRQLLLYSAILTDLQKPKNKINLLEVYYSHNEAEFVHDQLNRQPLLVPVPKIFWQHQLQIHL